MAIRKTGTNSSVPTQLLKSRPAIECNFVFSLWKEPSLFDDYGPLINPESDLKSKDGALYFEIVSGIIKRGFVSVDNMSVASYLMEHDDLKAEFGRRGGYLTVIEILDTIQPENIDGYYDELVKSNMLISLSNSGFDIKSKIDHYLTLTSEEIYDEIELSLSDTCAPGAEKSQAEDLSQGYGPYIEEWNAGHMHGTPTGYTLLNERLLGVHKKNLLLHMAHIGNGKTTSAIQFYVLPAIQAGQDVCIIANEQDVSEFRQMILSTVVCNFVGFRDINRSKFISGGYSQAQMEAMYSGQQWLMEQPGKIRMIETKDYSINNVRKIVKKYSKQNCSLFIFDTLKPMIESADRAWAEFSEVAKQLFLLAKKCDVAIVATAQLSSESMSRRYLDLSCVGKSRAIAETATQVVMFRSVSKSEIENDKIKAYIYDDPNNKYDKKMREIPLDIDKDYIVLFTPKNRFGSVGPPIIYERNMDYNSLTEIGFTDIDYDGYTRKG